QPRQVQLTWGIRGYFGSQKPGGPQPGNDDGRNPDYAMRPDLPTHGGSLPAHHVAAYRADSLEERDTGLLASPGSIGGHWTSEPPNGTLLSHYEFIQIQQHAGHACPGFQLSLRAFGQFVS